MARARWGVFAEPIMDLFEAMRAKALIGGRRRRQPTRDPAAEKLIAEIKACTRAVESNELAGARATVVARSLATKVRSSVVECRARSERIGAEVPLVDEDEANAE